MSWEIFTLLAYFLILYKLATGNVTDKDLFLLIPLQATLKLNFHLIELSNIFLQLRTGKLMRR